MPIVRKRICIGTYAVIDFDYKVTNSSPLTHKLTSKRLYFNYFKEQLDHFNGTAMILISCFLKNFAEIFKIEKYFYNFVFIKYAVVFCILLALQNRQKYCY